LIRRRRAELLLAGASVVFVLLAVASAELIARSLTARIVSEEARPQHLEQLHVYSERYGWEPRPLYRAELSGRRVSINRYGMRGREYALQRKPGVARVMVAGDSIAFGLDVGDHETFATLLDAKRAEWEVLNLAVQGYGTDQTLLRLQGLGLEFGPDIVILGFCLGNDFFDNALPAFLYDPRQPKPYYERVDGQLTRHSEHLRLGWAARAAVFLREHSALYTHLDASTPDAEVAERHWMRTVLELEMRWPTWVRLAARLVGAMQEEVRSAGGELLVALFPYHRSWDEGSPQLEFFKRLLAQEQGVRFVDMEQRFRERGLEFGDIAVDKLGHLSPRGHATTAQILDAELEAAR